MDFIIYLLLIINFAISAYNAWVVGKSWADVKAIGSTWQKVVVASAFIMSGCGFTWCYLTLFGIIAIAFGILDLESIQAVLNLGYVVIILPVLGSGIAIWIDSVTTAYRRRDLGSIGTAAWNTFAQAHNTYSALTNLGPILKSLGSFFKGGSSKGKGQILVVVLVIIALLLGFITTYIIAMKSASDYSQKVFREIGGQPVKAAGSH
jgi:hypothetical protein